MATFEFHSPTRIILGRETEAIVGELTDEYSRTELLHYGSGNIMTSSLYDKAARSLPAFGIDFVEQGGVGPNPRLSLVREGI